jgi:phenylacetate-CoA ligase
MNRAVGRVADRAAATRQTWLETIERHRHDRDAPGSAEYWSPRLDTASRDELRAIQDDKIAAVAPFLYENSEFYRRRFDRLGLLPSDLRTVDDLIAKWPVVDKHEMAEDAAAHPPYGTYTAMSEAIWAARGWMMFSSSGTTGAPRVFRYSHIDRELWAWANARALQSMDFRNGDTVFMITGYGPHVWAWGVQYALAKMGLATLPGGGMDARARANIVIRYQPTILLCTPSYALHLGRTVEALGVEPRTTAVRTLFVAGEPGMSVAATRQRIQQLWGARLVEFYGCTEASPHVGGFSCPHSQPADGPVSTHLLEDRAGLGDRRSAIAQAAGRRRARADRLHQSQFGILAAASFSGRRLCHFRPLALSVRPHPCAGDRFVRRARRRPHQSARHQDVSRPDRACRALDRRHRR